MFENSQYVNGSPQGKNKKQDKKRKQSMEMIRKEGKIGKLYEKCQRQIEIMPRKNISMEKEKEFLYSAQEKLQGWSYAQIKN